MAKSDNAPNTSLPRDDDSAPIQVLSPDPIGNVHVSATEGASASVTLPAGTQIVRIACSGAIFLAFGNGSVTAASGATNTLICPAGVEFFNLRDNLFTDVAARSLTGEGTVTITATKME